MKNRLRIGACLLLLLLLPGIVAAQNKPDELAQKLDAFFAEHAEETVGVSMSVFSDDTVLYERYHGYENREENRPMNEDTVVEWGSVTKLLTWVSVMQLVEQGTIDIETDIRTVLPEGFLTNLRFAKPVTMKDLMNHEAGFEEMMVNLFVQDADAVQPLEETLRERQPIQVFEPGSTTAYSNWGTALAAYIVEYQSGQDFADYVHEHIFTPLGMKHTALRPDLSDNPAVKERREHLNGYYSDGRLYENSDYAVPLYPAGMCTGTLADFRTFAQALLTSSREALLFAHPETMQEMLSATSVYASGRTRNAHGFWAHYLGSVSYGHGGNTAGCSSHLLFDPEQQIGVVVMTNQQNETTFTEGVRPLVFGEFIGSPFDTEKRDIPEGFYTTPRAVYHGPLALTQVGVMKATEEDLTMYWEEVDTGGEHRIQMAYMDIIRVEPASLLILLILAGGLLLGAVYGLLTLLGTGIAALWRRRKKPAAQIKHSGYRKWNMLAAGALVLFVLNIVILVLQLMSFQPLWQYRWQPVLSAVLALVFIALLFILGKAVLSKSVPGKRRVQYGFTALFLAIALCANIYWQMYQFWAL